MIDLNAKIETVLHAPRTVKNNRRWSLYRSIQTIA